MEIKIENFKINRKSVIMLNWDEYIILNMKKCNSNIIGLFTDGIFTCSSIFISINNEEIVFFCHINESTDIINILDKIIEKEICNINIKTLELFYTNGIRMCANNRIDYNNVIDKIISNFIKKFNIDEKQINKKMIAHELTTSNIKNI